MLRRFCFECRSPLPKRGYHCDICHVCIPQYDHHCTWINNCVGKHNIARFVFFLLFLVLSLAFVGLLSALAELCLLADSPYKYGEWFELRIGYKGTAERVAYMAVVAVNLVSALFIFPVLMLLAVQVKNLLRNKTTYETIRSPAESQGPIKTKMAINKSRMSLRNCRVMCSDSPSPTHSSPSLTTNDFREDSDSPLAQPLLQ
jgi:hypothetical protein